MWVSAKLVKGFFGELLCGNFTGKETLRGDECKPTGNVDPANIKALQDNDVKLAPVP